MFIFRFIGMRDFLIAVAFALNPLAAAACFARSRNCVITIEFSLSNGMVPIINGVDTTIPESA